MKRIGTIMTLMLLSFTMTVSAQTEKPSVTMMTYNIKGHGMTDERLDNIAKVINYWAADIVAVQEVDNRTVIGMKHNYLGDLAELTGMQYTFLPCVGTYYGIGLMSKEKPLSVTTKVFTASDTSKDKEDRGIIIAEFNDFFFIATHYSLNATDRDTATAWIVDFALNSDKTVFVAGDFNAQPTYRAMVTFKNKGFKILNDVNTETYPSDSPTSCIDMVLCYSDFDEAVKYDVADCGICTTPGVNLTTASDHLPVFVEVKPVNSGINDVNDGDGINVTAEAGGPRISGLKKTAKVRVTDMNGRQMRKTGIEDNGKIDMTKLPKGMYVIDIKNNIQKKTIKFMFNK